MPYTNEEITTYTNILSNYNNKQLGEDHSPPTPTCRGCNLPLKSEECRGVSGGCNPPAFLGQYICYNCGTFNGYVLGYYDIAERDRFFYKKKSIYNRKYHYEKKVDQISKRINLSEDEKCQLYDKLIKIDNNVMEIINKKFCRKRMINIFYLIKKILQEMGNEKYKLVYLKISPQTLENYEKWWENYLRIIIK